MVQVEQRMASQDTAPTPTPSVGELLAHVDALRNGMLSESQREMVLPLRVGIVAFSQRQMLIFSKTKQAGEKQL